MPGDEKGKLLERFKGLKTRREGLGRERAATVAVLNSRREERDRLRAEVEELGVDPDNLSEYLEMESERLNNAMDDYESSLNDSGELLRKTRAALEA